MKQLERAINLIAQRIIIVENVLAEWGANTNSRNKIKLPKTTNPLTGRESSGPYQFSAANWAVDTAAYKESIKNRNAPFICATFVAAQAFRHPKNGSSDNAPNPRALLCKAIISLLYWLFHVLKTLLEPFPRIPIQSACSHNFIRPVLCALLISCCRAARFLLLFAHPRPPVPLLCPIVPNCSHFII